MMDVGDGGEDEVDAAEDSHDDTAAASSTEKYLKL